MEIDVTTKEEFYEIIKRIDYNGAIYIFGAGKYGRIFGAFFEKMNVRWCGYVDSDPSLWGRDLKGKRIYNLEEIEKNNAYVMISISKFIYVEIYYDLIEMIQSKGIEKDKIIYFSDNFNYLVGDIIWNIKEASDYLYKLKEIKNKYLGKRCFIIGNGPSLKINDLEKLNKEITMGCNGIIQLYQYTDWRPTCYFFADPMFIKNYVNSRMALETILFSSELAFTNISNDIYDEYKDDYNNLYFLYEKKEIRFSEKMDEVTYTWGTSVFGMLQLAVYMGIKKIYLLGVDFSFKKEVYDGKLIVNDVVNTHMNLMDQYRQEGIYQMDIILQEFLTAKEYAESHGIKIYNATRGGKLEVFERVDFDSLF